jgi:hypothetical protein
LGPEGLWQTVVASHFVVPPPPRIIAASQADPCSLQSLFPFFAFIAKTSQFLCFYKSQAFQPATIMIFFFKSLAF